ncbi:MAG: hypothetical protein V2A78_09095 [bacterium]
MRVHGNLLKVVVLILCLLSLPSAFAADPPQASPPAGAKKIVFLQLPITLQGTFKPMERGEVLAYLEKDVETLAPSVDLIVPAPDDPRLNDLTPGSNPSPAMALKLAQAFQADFVCWGTISFALRQTVVHAGADSPVYQYLISVEGIADVQVFDPTVNTVVVDQTLFQSNNGVTRALENSNPYLVLEKKLATDCVQDISFELIRALKDRLMRLEQSH